MKEEGATQGLLAGGSKRVWAPQAAETHHLHDDPRAARRGSAEEQTAGGPKARTEGEGGRGRRTGEAQAVRNTKRGLTMLRSAIYLVFAIK